MKLYLRMQTAALGLLIVLCPLTYAHDHISTSLLTDPVQDGWSRIAMVVAGVTDQATDNELEGSNLISIVSEMPTELMLLRNPMVSPTSMEDEKESVDSQTLAIQDIVAALKKADDSIKALEKLHAQEHLKDKTILELQKALEIRNNELKEASSSLADLRSKQNKDTPFLPEQKRAYVAGLMIAKDLSPRIEAWKQAGVNIDTSMFLSGLKDGLKDKFQQTVLDVKHEKIALIKSIQNGVASKVQEAQKQLSLMAKDHRVIKSKNGITWYRIHAGKMIANGKPVKLSMTENVLGGRTISRVPPLTIRPEDSLPTLVREGMYLPGSGGEVVAYAMARDIYGKLPLPTGVYPWTVMEYHLRGEDFPPR